MQLSIKDEEKSRSEKSMWNRIHGFYSKDGGTGKSIKAKTVNVVASIQNILWTILSAVKSIPLFLPSLGLASLAAKILFSFKSTAQTLYNTVNLIFRFSSKCILMIFSFGNKTILYMSELFMKYLPLAYFYEKLLMLLENQLIIFLSIILNVTFAIVTVMNILIDK